MKRDSTCGEGEGLRGWGGAAGPGAHPQSLCSGSTAWRGGGGGGHTGDEGRWNRGGRAPRAGPGPGGAGPVPAWGDPEGARGAAGPGAGLGGLRGAGIVRSCAQAPLGSVGLHASGSSPGDVLGQGGCF